MARTAEITFKEFRRRYNTEDACRAELFRLRFPNGFVCPKEPLNKSPSAVSGSFPSTLRYRKREIHTVFRPFRYFDWPENLSLTALADLIILFLHKMISSFYESRFTADRLGGGKKCIDFVF